MGLQIAGINEHAIFQILQHEAAEGEHDFSDAFVMGGDDIAQIGSIRAAEPMRPENITVT
jgi:hypothetical protein